MIRDHAGDPIETNVGEHPHQMIEVLVLDSLLPGFERWLSEEGLHLFRIPPGEDVAADAIHTYGVGVQESKWNRGQ